MTYARQVWHVLAKDLRAQRGWLLAYVALLVLGTAPAWSAPLIGPGETLRSAMIGSAMIGLATVATACFACYGAFRADAALGTREHWVALPLARSAVFGAKLAFIGVMAVLLPLLVHAPAWLALDLPLTGVPPAWWDADGSKMFALIALALLTAGLRSGRTVALLFVVGGAAGPQLLASTVSYLSDSLSTLPLVLIAAGITLLALHRLSAAFRRREDTVRARSSLIGVGTLALVTPTMLGWAAESDTEPLEAVLPGHTLEILAVQDDRVPGANAAHVFLAPRPRDTRVVLTSMCSNERTNHSSWTSWARNDDYSPDRSPALPTDLTWRSGTAGPRAARPVTEPLEFRPVSSAWADQCSGTPRYLLAIVRDSLIATVPAHDGASLTHAGRRFSVRWPNDNWGSLTFALTVTSAPGQTIKTEDVIGHRSVRLVLVHTSRREAIELTRPMDEQPANANLPVHMERFATLSPEHYNGPPMLRWDTLQFRSEDEGRAWLREAVLYVIEQQWREVDITAAVRRARGRIVSDE